MDTMGWTMGDWGDGVEAGEACEVRGVGFTNCTRVIFCESHFLDCLFVL